MTRKRITICVQYTVTERNVERDGEYATAEHLQKALIDHLTHKDCGVRDDYGPDADGGYEGAYITSARLALSAIETI